jgi:type IV pilus assembly protein PilF
MTRHCTLSGILLVLLTFTLLSCATTNLEQLKKQEEASRNLGEEYLRQGNYTLALGEFLKAEEFYEKDPFLHNDLGLAYMLKGRLDLAIDHFQRAIELKPDYAPAKNNLGTAYMAQKDWDAAIASFKEVAGNLLYATPHYPMLNLGWSYYNKGDFNAAEAWYKDTLKYYRDGFRKDSVYFRATRGLGRTYLAQNKPDKAAEHLEKAVRENPRSAELFFELAGVYKVQRAYPKALMTFKKVLDLNPDKSLAEKTGIEINALRKMGYE